MACMATKFLIKSLLLSAVIVFISQLLHSIPSDTATFDTFKGPLRNIMRTKNFIIDCKNNTPDDLLGKIMSPKPVVSLDSPYLFSMMVYHVNDPSKILWQTRPGIPFIRSAIGDDSLTPGNGEYRIIQNNQHITTHQSISFVDAVPAGKVFEGKAVEYDRVIMAGTLMYQHSHHKAGQDQGRGNRLVLPFPSEPEPVLSYRLTFKETAEDVLEMEISIESLNFTKIKSDRTFDRIILTYLMSDDEEIYGLGEQFSFWSLKGERVPIICREQGIGRGLQPITYILNHVPPRKPAYSGGDTLSTYTAIPHYITSHGRSVFLHNTELAFFDFKDANQASIEVVSTTSRLSIYYGRRPLDLINTYTKHVSGRMTNLPGWVSGEDGAVIGVQGGQDKVYKVIEQLQEWGVKIASVWLQDWVGMRSQYINVSVPIPFIIPGFPSRTSATIGIKSTSPQKRLWWNWEHDLQSYPDWPQFVKNLKDKYKIRVMTYINPFLSDVERGGKSVGTYRTNYFKEARRKGYLIKRWVKKALNSTTATDDFVIEDEEDGNHVGVAGRDMLEVQEEIEDIDGEWKLVDYLVSSGPGVVAGMIDLTHPEGFEWYKGLIKNNMLAYGVSGWMADFAEYVPFDGVLYPQRESAKPPPEINKKIALKKDFDNPNLHPSSYHNIYPREWARLNREAVEEVGRAGKDVVFFVRSASPDTPKFASAFWNGDQMHTYDHLDGLESVVYATLSASLSGIAYQHSDVGGYTTLNVDPKVSITIGGRTTEVKLPILERRARYLRSGKELFVRWMETAAFLSTSMYRTHEGSVPDENIQVWQDEKIGKNFAMFTNLFMSLTAYRRLLQKEHEHYGYPPIRSLFLHYPHSNYGAITMERVQFMLGPLVLVIPITTPGIKRLNDSITEPEPSEEPDDDQNEFISSLKTKIRESQPQSPIGSDLESDEESVEEENPSPKSVRKTHSFKGQVVSTVKTWFEESFLTSLTSLVSSISHPELMFQQEQIVSPTTPKQNKWPSFSGKARQRQVRIKRKITAPVKLPKPRHGRAFLPPGNWTHLWSKTVFQVQDPSGLYLSDSAKAANLTCLPGQPAVFLRKISEQEMREIVKRSLMPSQDKSKGGEDVLYWLDQIDGRNHIAEEEDFDAKFRVAMNKYNALTKALRPFLDFVDQNRQIVYTITETPSKK